MLLAGGVWLGVGLCWALAWVVLVHVAGDGAADATRAAGGWASGTVLATLAVSAALPSRRVLVPLGGAVALAVAVGWLSLLWPRNDREWEVSVSRLPRITIEGDRCTIEDLRAFRWRTLDDFDATWDTCTYDLTTLESVEFFIEPFQGSELMAHTMLGFGFADGRRLVVSIEARKEPDERFGLLPGALRQFELIYVFADERDPLTQRAVGRNARLWAYPVRATPEQRRALFEGLVSAAQQLTDRPRFYHAIRSNCTTTIVTHADRLRERKIGLRPRTLFPALSGGLLADLGMMDTDLSFEQARERYRIDDAARRFADDPEFSARIRPWAADQARSSAAQPGGSPAPRTRP